MDINRIMKEADALFDSGNREEAAQYLEEQLKLAKDTGRWGIELPILSELMGYYRTKSMFEKAVVHAERALMLVRREELDGTPAATTYMNVASLYRAMKNPVKAMELYLQAEKIYLDQQVKGNMLSALYNNMCVAALDLKEPELAEIYGEKAIEALQDNDNYRQASAIIYTNLAGYYLQEENERLDEAEEYLNKAIEIYETYFPDDAHFAAALAMRAYILKRKGDPEGALLFYRQALERTEKVYGKNNDYYMLLNNCKTLCQELGRDCHDR